MINLEYVNGSISMEVNSITKPFESFLESSKNDINQMFAEFDILSEKVTLESSIMGSVPESVMMVYESEKKNIFSRVGEMIVTIYNKFVEFIDSIIDKIKTFSFRKKSDLQKLDILLKNHPDLKNEAIAAFNSGALDLSDVRSLKELDSTFDEILKLAKKKDIDPKTLRGKWEKAKEKFEKDEKSWKIVKVAAATTTVITATIALKTFSAKCAQANNSLAKDKQEMRERKAKILEDLKNEGIVTDATGVTQLKLQIWRELNGYHSAVRGEHLSVIDRMANGISRFVDKFTREAGKRLQDDFATAKKKADAATKAAYDDSIKKTEDEADAKNRSSLKFAKDMANAKKAADSEYYTAHRREELKKSADDAYRRTQATEAAKKNKVDPNKK